MAQDKTYLHIFTSGYLPRKDWAFAYAFEAGGRLSLGMALKKDQAPSLASQLEEKVRALGPGDLPIHTFNPQGALRLLDSSYLRSDHFYSDCLKDLYQVLKKIPQERVLEDNRLETCARAGGQEGLVLDGAEEILGLLKGSDKPDQALLLHARTYIQALKGARSYLDYILRGLRRDQDGLGIQVLGVSLKKDYTIITGRARPGMAFYYHRGDLAYEEDSSGKFSLSLQTLRARYDQKREGVFYQTQAPAYNPLPMPPGYMAISLAGSFNARGVLDLIFYTLRDLGRASP